MAKILLFLALAYTGTLTYFSLIVINFKVSVAGFDPTDKMLHAGAYLFLTGLWKLFFVFKKQSLERYNTNLWWVALACFMFGMLIEVLQGTLTSYRTPDWWDVVANSTGVALAVLFFMVLAPTVKKFGQKFSE